MKCNVFQDGNDSGLVMIEGLGEYVPVAHLAELEQCIADQKRLTKELDQLQAVLHGAVDELIERISLATQSIQCEDGAGSFVSAGAVNNAVSHLRKSINDPVNHLATHDADVIERFRSQLRDALFPHGRTRACYTIGDFDYVYHQARQQAQEVQS